MVVSGCNKTKREKGMNMVSLTEEEMKVYNILVENKRMWTKNLRVMSKLNEQTFWQVMEALERLSLIEHVETVNVSHYLFGYICHSSQIIRTFSSFHVYRSLADCL
eukprot:TRINITY_DN3266_c0_g1_i2.p1 TRINITY_DN3266_c0_g1~~TRINITY_DN3266_c0_g1_i2.p1  ORF type:complete len:106 (+),score=5.00 TRINITY_DN3266_c0_g1_i2:50-367(+)